MHEMLSIFTNVCGVSLSVMRRLNLRRRLQCTPHAVCAGHVVQPSPNAFGLLLCNLFTNFI